MKTKLSTNSLGGVTLFGSGCSESASDSETDHMKWTQNDRLFDQKQHYLL